MKHYGKMFVLCVLAAISMTGCFGPIKQPGPVNYYILEYDPPAKPHLKKLPFSIWIDRFKTASIYDSNNIFYQTKPFELKAYNYHKWQANPSLIITDLLARDMRQSGLFSGIFNRGNIASFSFRIEGVVDEFFEQDKNNLWTAVLTVNIALLSDNEKEKNKNPVFQKKYHARKTCEKKTPRSLAQSMSMAMAEISEKIITDVYQALLSYL